MNPSSQPGTPLRVGDPAPDFTLIDDQRQPVTLSAFRGENVLLLFFPAAFTSVCTAELCSVRDSLERYGALNARPFGISVDLPFTLARFKEEQRLNFSLLSDFNKEVSRAYGCLYENWILGLKGVSKRAAFLVDRQGVIRYAEVLENAGDLPNFELINKTLEEMEPA
ncbi:redoxin domain-containing protein [Flaviaesturariibacter flavus]|uniref:Redoxin domain-containing protein n=1 Tax=Flaviaesturariibacter flavus TaxID=2502780 RepID=A0A4R1BBS7_9BACT|nr:redoxin domain-containing protein [Flaviaesturariibacter flavus]TCJ14471.1 redoxin domain-containing protein [Flaviaesturariibacter flavus]